MSGQILIVDDSATIRDSLSKLLGGAGYNVHAAGSGKEALAICEENSFDLMISDLNMPVMDGLTLVGTVRKMPGKRFMPIIILSSENDSQKEGVKLAGASGWISKPFKPEQVISIVKMVMQ